MAAMPAHLRSIVDHDGAVILDIKRDEIFSLNPVGAYIWARLLDGEGLEQIVTALAEETGMDIARRHSPTFQPSGANPWQRKFDPAHDQSRLAKICRQAVQGVDRPRGISP